MEMQVFHIFCFCCSGYLNIGVSKRTCADDLLFAEISLRESHRENLQRSVY